MTCHNTILDYAKRTCQHYLELFYFFVIGKYISANTRNGIWGEGAIDAISKKLDRELPGLRGFSGRNLRYMRTFYEEWSILESIPNCNLETAVAKTDSCSIELPILSSKIISLYVKTPQTRGYFLGWSGRQDLNLRPSVPKTDAIPSYATSRLWRASQESNS